MAGLRIAYAGTPKFAVPALRSLIADYPVVAVITQPDRRAGRGRRMTPSPVKAAALEAGLSVLQPENINSPKFLQMLKELSIDLMVVAAFGQLFSQTLLDLPRLGCLNIHASILPRWRGASPIQHAILAGDKETGVTIMQMEKRMDAGQIWLQSKITIQDDDTAETLHDRLADLAGGALLAAIKRVSEPGSGCSPQDESQATYCSKLNKSDGQVDWQDSAELIARKVRAFYPWPGTYTTFKGRRLSIIEAVEESVPASGGGPGHVLAADKDGILVQTSKGALRILVLVPAGGKQISAADFVHANPLLHRVLGDDGLGETQ